MNRPPIPPAGPTGPGLPGDEDPAARQARLTALALGELSTTEAGELEATIWRDTDARLELAKIRELAEQLTFAYAAEPPATLTPSQHRAILERQSTRLTGSEEKEARLTAYALGELRPSQAEILSARLSDDRAATLELEAVGALAARLRTAFAEEPVPMLTLEQRQAILDRGPMWATPPDAASPSENLGPLPVREAISPGRSRRWLRTAALAAGFAALGYVASLRDPAPARVAEVRQDPLEPPRSADFFPPLPPAPNQGAPQFVALLDREKERPAAEATVNPSPVAADPGATVTPAPEPAAKPEAVPPAVAGVPAEPRRQPDASVLPPPRKTVAGTSGPRVAPDAATVLHTPMAAPGHAALAGFLATADVGSANLPADLGRSGYDVIRQCVRDFGTPPPAALVRPEEIINQFDYDVQPAPGQDFAVAIEAADCPWNQTHQLVRVTVAARAHEVASPPLKLTVFLRLGDSLESERSQLLAWQGLQALAARLRPADSVSVVVWGSAHGLVLPATSVAEVENLREAPTRWHEGGVRHGTTDWDTVEQALFRQASDNALNLCLVLTDGPLDFTGLSLADAVHKVRPLGFEVAVAELGPLRPGSRTAALADLATVPYFRADSGPEAERLLAQEIFSGSAPVAEDVQIRVAFNPSALAAWRPIGFNTASRGGQESVMARSRAWTAGRQVTALYEVVPAVVPGTWPTAAVFASPALRESPRPPAVPKADPPLSVRLHYRVPLTTTTHSLTTDWTASAAAWRTASPDFRLAAGAAAFALRLQDDPSLGAISLDRIGRWVRTAAEARDPFGLRREFASLLEAVERLKPSDRSSER